jgi:hypothetical protein
MDINQPEINSEVGTENLGPSALQLGKAAEDPVTAYCKSFLERPS